MKKDEIQKGKIYHNGKGQERRVIQIKKLEGYKYADVIYETAGIYDCLDLLDFAKWAKGEKKP